MVLRCSGEQGSVVGFEEVGTLRLLAHLEKNVPRIGRHGVPSESRQFKQLLGNSSTCKQRLGQDGGRGEAGAPWR